MPLDDQPSDVPAPHAGRLWKAVREETREVVWLVAVVGALSVAGVAVAIILAGHSLVFGTH